MLKAMSRELTSDVIEKLPPELQVEVYRFAKRLMAESTQTQQPPLRQDWAEMLKDCNYKSVELQHIGYSWRMS